MATSVIKRAYQTKKLVGSFSGLPAFVRARKYKNAKEAAKALSELDSYTLHKRIKRKFQRRPTRVFFQFWQFGADLMSIQNVRKYNKGYQYILVRIRLFCYYSNSERKTDLYNHM
jgi:hypothetical protein